MFSSIEENCILTSSLVFNLFQYHTSCNLLKSLLYTHKEMRVKKVSLYFVEAGWKQHFLT